MKIRSGWGRNFMEKFSWGGAKKGTERETELTPATKISGRPMESPKKLVNTFPTRSSQQARQGTVDSSNLSNKLDEKRQEEWDKETTDVHSVNQQEPGAKLDITMIVKSMKRGNRSAQQRRKSSVPWVELLGLNFRNVERARRNDQAVGSKKMKRICRGTKLLCLNNRGAKGKKSVEGGSDASNQSTPTNLDKAQDTAADANDVQHLSVPKSGTSPKSKEQFSIDADEHPSKQSGVPIPADDINDNGTDFNKSKDAIADGLMTTTDVISLYEAKESHTKFDPAVIPGLDLEDGAENFDTSTAQSALASLSTVSAPDPCIEFAVKILKDETPLTAYVPEADEIIRNMMCHQKSTTAETSKSAQGRKG